MAAMIRHSPAAPSTEKMPIMIPLAVEPSELLCIRTASWCEIRCPVNMVGGDDGAWPVG